MLELLLPSMDIPASFFEGALGTMSVILKQDVKNWSISLWLTELPDMQLLA